MTTEPIPVNDHYISLDRAIDMTKRYRENRESILSEKDKGKNLLPLSETVNKEALLSFFNNPVCAAVRIYYGMSDDRQVHAIIVGVNDKNEDLLPHATSVTGSDSAIIVEDLQRCPPACPPDSVLNNP